YNFDLGNNVVLGIDGDVTYNDVSKDIDVFAGGVPVGDFETKLRWSGAVRARVGYAVDRFMPYLAGGVAFGNIKNSGSIDNIGSFSES
ncbi:hypothetical protein LNK15_13690, partial [Jeotgalicoccus huakuii]|nr:hypothetical protein [Jeotgalicoccus huakuii]